MRHPEAVARADVSKHVTELSPDACGRQLAAARRGNADAFLGLVQPHQRRLQSLAYRLLESSEDTLDVMQEVYLSAYRGLPKFRGDADLSTWLYRITYNACLAHITRRRPAENQSADHEPACADYAEDVAARMDLAAALSALPPEQRALVLLIDRDGLDYRSAATALGLPLGTVSSRLALARRRLRAALSLDKDSP
jgi:RNA polymerase sigma-70 factor (ECF subfamily)